MWDNVFGKDKDTVTVNLPIDKETDFIRLETGYPDEGCMKITVKEPCELHVRKYPWMGNNITCTVDGTDFKADISENMICFGKLQPGTCVEIRHEISTYTTKEHVGSNEYTVYWRGCDVIDITPHGEHLRLYQRDNEKEKYYPTKETVKYTGAFNYGPTQQKKIRR